MTTFHPIGRGKHLGDERSEVCRRDRHPVDDDALPVADEVRLGRLPDPVTGRDQHGAHQGLGAALAVGAPDQRAAKTELWRSQLGQQRARPGEPEADAEAATRLQGRDSGGLRRHHGWHPADDTTR